MEITQEKLREMLVPPGHVTEEKFSLSVAHAEQKKISISDALVQDGIITDENLGKTIADFYDYRFVDLGEMRIDENFLEYLPEVVARAQGAIVFGVEENVINLATENVDNYEFIKLLEKKTGKKIALFYATHAHLDLAFKYYKGNLYDAIQELIKSSVENQHEGDIVKLVNIFLEYASDSRASDIHIEPLDHDVLIRFRVDGILHVATRYPKSLHEKIIFRIKIMSRLQTDEHSAVQDGRFNFTSNDNVFDVRVSILPITDGENVVMRLLDSHTHKYTLENLGLGDSDYKKIVRASEKPHGMIIAVGPTGSGKTTVLYTILEKLNTSEVNITTIEDPVEYDIEGVQQTQMNVKKNLTFANGLRSIVRQDPDIIMVGEIRDEETADISINAALTGHLLLSSLHTNDAATTFPRLMEMNVEPFLIASSVNLIIAVRLVRKICDHCKVSYIPEGEELDILKMTSEITQVIRDVSGNDDISHTRLYRGSGCKMCGQSGYNERIGIFEILEMDEAIRLLVIQKSSAEDINTQAVKSGMTSLLHDGVVKTLSGVTTFDEVLRAVRT